MFTNLRCAASTALSHDSVKLSASRSTTCWMSVPSGPAEVATSRIENRPPTSSKKRERADAQQRAGAAGTLEPPPSSPSPGTEVQLLRDVGVLSARPRSASMLGTAFASRSDARIPRDRDLRVPGRARSSSGRVRVTSRRGVGRARRGPFSIARECRAS